MKVFLSWSGDLSRRVSEQFRDWLPSVLQSVDPYVSSEDIDKGARWATDIAKELEASSFGILCVTSENKEAPWLHFEAGALSKTVDRSRVCPFLFGVKQSDIQGPLLQFQSAVYERSDVRKLVISINAASGDEGLEDARIDRVFDVWWPKLKEGLDQLQDAAVIAVPGEGQAEEAPHYEARTGQILEEILELTRNQQRLLRSPEELLPMGYLQEAVGGKASFPQDHPVWEHLLSCVAHAKEVLQVTKGNDEAFAEIGRQVLEELLEPAEYLSRRTGRTRRMLK